MQTSYCTRWYIFISSTNLCYPAIERTMSSTITRYKHLLQHFKEIFRDIVCRSTKDFDFGHNSSKVPISKTKVCRQSSKNMFYCHSWFSLGFEIVFNRNQWNIPLSSNTKLELTGNIYLQVLVTYDPQPHPTTTSKYRVSQKKVWCSRLSIYFMNGNTQQCNNILRHNKYNFRLVVCEISTIYVLRSSGISRKSEGLIVRYSQKKECISFVFYCFWESFNCYNFGTTGPIQVGFSANVPLLMRTSIQYKTENVTCSTSDWFP